MKPLNLNSLLQKIFEAVQPMLASRSVTLTTDLAAESPIIEGDQEQLQQVFLNLINNAIDAMPAGGTLHFGTSVSGEWMIIECEDTGEGIADDVKDHIFEPLFTTKEQGQGTGLGLSVARQIIEEHKGRLDFDSKVGYGSRFTISLPISTMGSNEMVLTELVIHGKEENHKDTKSTKI
jgi:two-component system NtrC family sensor kinase